MTPIGHLQRTLWRGLSRLDAGLNRLYGWRHNPLYQSGTIAAALLAVVTITGIYLFLFYRIGDPYASVARITDQAWTGRWIRSLHRYASDAAVVAVAVHGFRMFVQGRTWGARALAWVSGVVLLGLLFVCGWTGYVMVWDVQAQVLTTEGARLLDRLPIFAEPISRTFVGDRPIPGAFFFMNLFLHLALPVGMGIALWLHVSRLARPHLVPPPRLAVAVVGLLTALAVVVPVPMDPEADLLRIPSEVPLDFLYAFWVPFVRAVPPWAAWGVVTAVSLGIALVPWWARPPAERRPAPSSVDDRLCTACDQCYLDCPYEAIAMVPRTDGKHDRVARVDPALCVACGICAGSCAPMGVGPPGRTGRDQLARLREGAESESAPAGELVLVACDRGAGDPALADRLGGLRVHRVGCVGNLHTSVVEWFLKEGAAGVLVLACPPRDCWSREGPEWARQRLFEDREAELHQRVDKRRVRLVHLARGEARRAESEIQAFRADLAALGSTPSGEVELIRACEVEPQEATP